MRWHTALRPLECDPSGIAIEIDASSSIWDKTCGSLAFSILLSLTFNIEGLTGDSL